MRQRLVIQSDGEPLDGMLHLPGPGRRPCAVAAHGLLSSKASDKYLRLGDDLTKAGFAFFRFDFRGCGESGGSLQDTTVGGRIRDLMAVLTCLRQHEALDGRIFLMGSSLGGYVALFVARDTPEVKATALWATPVHLRDLLGRKESLTAHGLGPPFFRELERGTYLEAPAGLSRCLIIHGERDELVPCEHGRALFARVTEPKMLEILPGADHRLTVPADRERAIRLTTGWFERHR